MEAALERHVALKDKSRIPNSLSVLLFILIWELLPRLGWVDSNFISPPSLVLQTLWEMVKSGEILTHVGYSLNRAFFGFILAAVTAIPLGLLLGGGFKTLQRILTPLLRLLGEVNPFSLFPVFMLLFGIDELSKIAIIFWVCQWPILFNTITGVKNVDPLLIKSAKSMGADRRTLIFKVIIPSAAPNIFHGLKISASTAFFMLIAAEMIGASSGLGWLIWNTQVNYQISKLFAATVVISVLGLIINKLFTAVENKLIVWRQNAFDS